jgi:UDP-perosamine 4-acetyltransferase
MKKRAVILGGGGHAKVVIDILGHADDVELVGFTSKDGRGETLCGCPCIGTDVVLNELFLSGVRWAFVAIGENDKRKACLNSLKERGFDLINAISKAAAISRYARLGLGIAAMPGAVINAGARLEDGVIVNTNACVDHDCIIGSCAHIGPGTSVTGCVRVGEGSFLGAGSSVIPGVSIGCWTVIGAGAAVVNDLPDHVVAVGVPATVRESRAPGFRA